MDPTEIAVIGMLVVAFTVVSARIERLPLTMPIVFVSLGALTAAIGLVDVAAELDAVGLLAEFTLAVILFSDASRISLRRLRRHIALPTRLLAVGLPLTIIAGAGVTALLFGDWPFAQALLVAAILAPTDAALGSAVIEDQSVPARDRLALNVESGVNDGLVVPVVTIATSVVLDTGRSAAAWVEFAAQQVGYGLLVGIVVGMGGIAAIGSARRAGWSDGRYEQIATFALPIIALCGALAVDGNGFIAAFVAGLSFGAGSGRFAAADDVEAEHLTEFTEDAAQLLGVAAFFVFGNLFFGDALAGLSPAVVAAALASLTLVRILPVLLSLTRSGLAMPSKLFMGWFGPRGLASIAFGILLLEEVEHADVAGVDAEDLFAVITVTVILSVLLHGASASFGAGRYGQWAAQHSVATSDDDRVDAMTPIDDEMPRARWGSRSTS